MRITVDSVMATKPCDDWPRSRVKRWFGSRRYALSTTMLRDESLDIDDRLWLGIYLLAPTPRRLYVCECSERALLRERAQGREPHRATWKALETSRRYAQGQCSDDDLLAAANAAGNAAARAAYWAAYNAAWSTTDDAARSVDGDAASMLAEKRWQLGRLIEYHKGEAR